MALDQRDNSKEVFKPLVLNPKNVLQKNEISRLIRLGKATATDDIDEQLKELALVKKPQLLFKSAFGKEEIVRIRNERWVYYPWRNTIVHILGPHDYTLVRTSRNRNLILAREQMRFDAVMIGIAGLNVGNPIGLCLALESCVRMKLADNDSLSLSNLNRFRASLTDLGINKAVLTARQIYEINPYADVVVFQKGIELGKAERFLLKPRIDILVEEMDNLKLKVEIREKARQLRIPVVMVTGNGEDIIVDVERFDKTPHLPFLNGLLRKRVIRQVKSSLRFPLKMKIELARDFIGARYLNSRLKESFGVVGSEIAGIPQLAESSFLRGAAAAYVIRQLAMGKKLPSGRYHLRLSSLLR